MDAVKTTLLMALLTVLLVLIGGTSLSLAGTLQTPELGSQQIPMNANAASAHVFIANQLTGGGMMELFSTHPPVPERVHLLEDISRTHDY